MPLVKSLRSVPRSLGSALAGAGLILAGCATHAIGIVAPADDGVHLSTVHGEDYRLVLDDEARPLGYLDGHTAEVEGAASFGRLRVQEWSVLEGLHGLPVWVGVLQWRQGDLGLQDRNTGAFYYIDPDNQEVLEPFVGTPVLLEGYVEGDSVVATRLEREDPDNAVVIGGPLEDVDDSTDTVTLLGLGPIDVSSADFSGGIDTTSDLKVGDVVEIDWDNFSDLGQPADEIALED